MKLRGFLGAALTIFSVSACQEQTQAQAQERKEALGALGIAPGTPIDRLTVLRDAGRGEYRVRPPLEHPDGHEYYVTASKSTGVCAVSFFTKAAESDSFGYTTRSRFSTLQSQLEAKYGPATTKDYRVDSKSFLAAPNHWVAAIEEEVRTYAEFWNDEGALQPYGVGAIDLQAVAYSSIASAVYVFYEYANYDLCQKELKTLGGSAL